MGLGLARDPRPARRSASSPLVAFVAIERRAASPVVDFEALRSKQFLGREHRRLHDLVRDAGDVLLPRPLHAEHPRLLARSRPGSASCPRPLVIIVAGPIAGRLADRFGPRPLMVGRAADRPRSRSPGSRASRSTRATASSPARSCCMGLGMGLVMSPMSMAAMNAVDRTKAGVASGTLSMFRMVGGTFGVAALGALVAAVGRHDLEQSLPADARAARASALVDGLGSGAGAGGRAAAGRRRGARRVRGRARHGPDGQRDRGRDRGGRGLVPDLPGPAGGGRPRRRRLRPRPSWPPSSARGACPSGIEASGRRPVNAAAP